MKTVTQLIACFLISIILGTSLYGLTTPIALPDNDNEDGYFVTLELYQYRDGELIDTRIVEDDYILRNLVYIYLLGLAGDRSVESRAAYKIIDLTNVERTGSASSGLYFTSTDARIRVGTGSNPVSISNYALQTEVMTQVVDDGKIWSNGNQFNVTADSTMVSPSAYAIRECGLSVSWFDASAFKTVLICRDVFSAINLNAGDVLTVRYIFRFNY